LPSAKVIVGTAYLIDLFLVDCLKHRAVGRESCKPFASPSFEGLTGDRNTVSLIKLPTIPLIEPLEEEFPVAWIVGVKATSGCLPEISHSRIVTANGPIDPAPER